MPASDRQSGFHHSFFEPIFCFLPGPARSAASAGAPLPSASAPCFNCFRVSASTVSDTTTVLIFDSELSYLPSFYLLTRFLNSAISSLAINVSTATSNFQAWQTIPERSEPCGLHKSNLFSFLLYETCFSLRAFLLLFTVIPYGPQFEDDGITVQNI